MTIRERIIPLLETEPCFAEIARELGVSGEYVRLVAKSLGMRSRYQAIRREVSAELAFPVNFPRRVKRWLRDAGYRRCGFCLLWFKKEDLPSHNVCLHCNAIRVNAYRHRIGRAKSYYPDSRRKYPATEVQAVLA